MYVLDYNLNSNRGLSSLCSLKPSTEIYLCYSRRHFCLNFSLRTLSNTFSRIVWWIVDVWLSTLCHFLKPLYKSTFFHILVVNLLYYTSFVETSPFATTNTISFLYICVTSFTSRSSVIFPYVHNFLQSCHSGRPHILSSHLLQIFFDSCPCFIIVFRYNAFIICTS